MFKGAGQFLIKLYGAAVSPAIGKNCRFHPTCSAYAHEALEEYGFFKGSWLAVKRISRCHPFYKGERIDPVPKSQKCDHTPVS